MADLIKEKRKRSQFRRQQTISINGIETLLENVEPDLCLIKSKMDTLIALRKEMQRCDDIIMDSLYDTTTSEDELNNEFDKEMEYTDKFNHIQRRVSNLEAKVLRPQARTEGGVKCGLKLPKIVLRTFSGELSDWLPFWSQFKTIDEDESLPATIKLQYLLNSMVQGTTSYRIVAGFPVTEENYKLAVEALKERFGNTDLLLQVHIRELLKLFIFTIEGKKKMTLVEFHDELETHLKSLEALKFNKADPATILFPLVESCLPKDILIAWQRSLDSEVMSTTSIQPGQPSRLDNLRNFVRKEVRRQLNVEVASKGFQFQDKILDRTKETSRLTVKTKKCDEVSTLAGFQIGDHSCIFCNKTNHESKDCFKAQKMNKEDRETIVKKRNLCFRCLGIGHISRFCKKMVKCSMCGKGHHTVMCTSKVLEKTETQNKGRKDEPIISPFNTTPLSNLTGCSNQSLCTDQVLLQTLIVKVGWDGKKKKVRLFMDPGSQRSYIKNSIAIELGLPIVGQEECKHSLFGGQETGATKHNIYPAKLFTLEEENEMKVFLKGTDIICGSLPRIHESHVVMNRIRRKGIILTDIGPGHPQIDILIGSDYYLQILKEKPEQVSEGLAVLETTLGWVIAGESRKRDLENSMAMTILNMNQIESNLKCLWDLEAIGVQDSTEVKTKDEISSEIISCFQKSIKRKDDGRYVVRLPWKENHLKLLDNRTIAIKRLELTTKKLKNSSMYEVYDQVFQEWIKEGFIESVQNKESTGGIVHYIPHRPVFKDSPTTPVRPVFDASCKGGSHLSLNDCLETGTNYVKMIPELLLRFREKYYGIISDIRKAFQMIEVIAEDRDACRFLWWKDGTLVEFRHTRVMFGTTCSPFILGAVLEYHLKNINDQDQDIAKKLFESFYVDNCVTSVDSVNEYEEFKTKAINILANAKMDLRMWMSNGDFVEDDEVVSVLGVQWNRNFDELFVDIKDTTSPDQVTKCVVLSLLARIFDPIGFLAPILLPIKKLLQRTWILDLKWDEELPPKEKKEFFKFMGELSDLSKIRIPRLATDGVTDKELLSIHVFTDASQDAYAAAIFLRVEHGSYGRVQLIASKSRVAPVHNMKKKILTIPRLELMGCLIGCRLLSMVRRALRYEDVKTFCWSDSSTAIAWIQNEKPWGTFVSNRVKEIRGITDTDCWRHVPGEENPADLPSRGCSINDLYQSKWWEGPQWLRRPIKEWPLVFSEVNDKEVTEELKKGQKNELISIVGDIISNNTQRNLTFFQTVRVLAWMIRFQENTKKSKTDRNVTLELSSKEINRATRRLVKLIQSEGITEVHGRKPSLKVVESSDGVLCVETRLTFRDDLPGFKFPMLLPKDHELTRKLILEMHLKNSHAPVNVLMVKLRENFWIPQLRKTIKSILNKCGRCRRYTAKKIEVVEPPLPLDRVRDSEVFDVVGVDLAGPLFLRGGKKVWIVLYTCAVYRAIHLDLVTSLSTPAFIKSMEKFVTRYHRPNIVYSDNGTNFKGTDNLFKSLDWVDIMKTKGLNRIQWKFNVPLAPWWGGWWERLIRSVKDLLKRNLGKASLTLDELRKVLDDITTVINNRPLTYVSEDQDDLQPLTPWMFLNPTTLLPPEFPEGELSEPEKLRRRYKHIKCLKEELRIRFRNEYLGQLKSTVYKSTPELKEGDIVLMGSDNMKRFEWPIGRILELIPGKDKVKRVAIVRTKDGNYTRPVQRLYKMEMEEIMATELKKASRRRILKKSEGLQK